MRPFGADRGRMDIECIGGLIEREPSKITQLNDARDMTLRDLAQYAPELTPAVFAQVDAELAKIPMS